jgi:methylated-DNA-[protein]-cysteine S-methyltransferase
MHRVPPFHRRVYDVARTIPPGATLSYGNLAARLGQPGAARAVGQAMRRNPFPLVVPCHRVVASGGRIGGFSANGGIATKLRLLAIEAQARRTTAPLGSPDTAPASVDGRLGFDPDVAIAHLRVSDPVLARLIDRVGPLRLQPQRTASIFGALAEAIVYQQLTARAAAPIFARVSVLASGRGDEPTAEQMLSASTAELRATGLSRSKIRSLRDLARRTIRGDIPTLVEVHSMTDEAIIERLTSVRGIGRWTTEMLLIFHLGRPDVFPMDDYGLRKGFAVAFRKRALPSRHELETRGARWRPYRTVASWYLWRAAEISSLKSQPASLK